MPIRGSGRRPASVSALSLRRAGLRRTATSATVAAELERLNAAYEARFGFRYCVFVAGRSRGGAAARFGAALEADRDAEIDRALDAVVDIARDRHADADRRNGEARRDRTRGQPLRQGGDPPRPGRRATPTAHRSAT